MKKLIILTTIILYTFSAKAQQSPLDDITQRDIVQEKLPLAYAPVQERDIFWENRIWRVIDIREKMNLPFANPERPFFTVLVDAAQAGKITLYDTETDDFSYPMNEEALNSKLSTRDTVEIWTEAETMELRVVENEINPEDIKRYRVKEVWYFDSQASVMKVRILGIAPLQEVFDDFGNFKYEKPMFWVHYPSTRNVLAKELAFTEGNQAARTTWEDLLERRQFASTIYKQSDVLNRRLEDMYSGVDRLMEANKIKQEVFNVEQDFWSY